ncbi:head-tail adaptor protein [Streptomyces sp. C10-9-1]|uniref:head-tail adaptor protein n=1 Tax=Streptomyces sp. C10-9-1 TaxID=1859285 RepID=UPI003F49D0B3
MSIGRLLTRELEVRRPTLTPDGLGGQEVTYPTTGTVRAKVDQPAASERILADRAGSEHTHTVYLLPTADVRRGDQLHGAGQQLRVLHTVAPSTARYLRAECQLIQREGV